MADDTIKLELDDDDEDDVSLGYSVIDADQYARDTVKRFIDGSDENTIKGCCIATKTICAAVKAIWESPEREHGIFTALSLINIGILHARGQESMAASVIDQLERANLPGQDGFNHG